MRMFRAFSMSDNYPHLGRRQKFREFRNVPFVAELTSGTFGRPMAILATNRQIGADRKFRSLSTAPVPGTSKL